MRMVIDIDDALITEAMTATGLPTKEAVTEAALRYYTTHHARKKALEELRGMGWYGDLDEMRSDMGPNKDDHQDAAE